MNCICATRAFRRTPAASSPTPYSSRSGGRRSTATASQPTPSKGGGIRRRGRSLAPEHPPRQGRPSDRRGRRAANLASPRPGTPPGVGAADPRHHGQQRQNHHEGAGQPRTGREVRSLCHPGQPEQPHRRTADPVGDDPRRGVRHRGDGCERVRGDRPALLDRGTQLRHRHQHRTSPPGRFRAARRVSGAGKASCTTGSPGPEGAFSFLPTTRS